MRHAVLRLTAGILLTGAALALSAGCTHRQTTHCPTPASSGINTRDLIDPPAQEEQEKLMHLQTFEEVALKVRSAVQAKAPPGRPPRNVLCLSGGGSFGAYSAGVLCGWTERGDRPCFDVVTGISTGALIAPFAFLGPQYDQQMKEFYTTLENRDIYKLHPVRGLLGESLADNAPLGRQIDKVLTPQMIAEVAEAHRQGRRLYIGTTEEEGKRFIVWDLGAIACRNGPGDRELIRQILLGSSGIPGFFPASKIDVWVDGRCYTERHIDGGVSQGIFLRPPYVPPELQDDPAALNMAGTQVWAIVAGKIYADPEVIKDRSLANAGKSVSTIIYAQTRGDLQRMYTLCLLNGMDLYITAIPATYPAPVSATEFKPEVTSGLFEEGRRVIHSPEAWRTSPPGALREEGELIQSRAGRSLTYQQRGPILPIHAPRNRLVPPLYPLSDQGIPAVPPIRD
ncbi:MAG TPA: patatin-like phospholipase family protein [Gemmataceae bacterium]|nr:patatin-like phospholipase family protein [Gemmataceae bacterium]